MRSKAVVGIRNYYNAPMLNEGEYGYTRELCMEPPEFIEPEADGDPGYYITIGPFDSREEAERYGATEEMVNILREVTDYYGDHELPPAEDEDEGDYTAPGTPLSIYEGMRDLLEYLIRRKP